MDHSNLRAKVISILDQATPANENTRRKSLLIPALLLISCFISSFIYYDAKLKISATSFFAVKELVRQTAACKNLPTQTVYADLKSKFNVYSLHNTTQKNGDKMLAYLSRQCIKE